MIRDIWFWFKQILRRWPAAAVILVLIGLGYPIEALRPEAKVTAYYRKHDKVLLNDLSITPGKARTTSMQEVCHGGSTKQYRHTTEAEKNQVYAWYGAKKKPGVCCEVDHLISLELGGADEVENLWPQPYLPTPGAHEKDQVENWLHKQVCEGKMSLEFAQKMIADDWYTAYQQMHMQAQSVSYWAKGNE